MNISGTLNVFRLLRDPTLCLPQHTVSTFNHLPIPLSTALAKRDDGAGKNGVDIRAVVLDKDNCFAVPHTNEIHPPYYDHFQRLRQAYPGSKLLIVSNTAGTDSDQEQKEATMLEANTGVKVLRHSTKKPGCKAEVMAYFRAHPDAGVTQPDQIAIVGDRLSTDIIMANMMGSYGIWVRDGVTGRGLVGALSDFHAEKFINSDGAQFARMEDRLQSFLFRRGYRSPDPARHNQFE
ncbi:hypothetical protein ACEQ8H_002118 [Pleosporales sp. CAS-2024a]